MAWIDTYGHHDSVSDTQSAPDDKRNRRSRGPSIQAVPTVIMVVIMGLLAALYFGVREVRIDDGASDVRNAQSSEGAGSWTFVVPGSWHDRDQGDVAKASGRWWSGPATDARSDGLFVTSYRLVREPMDRDLHRLRSEALASLKKTGAPKSLRDFKNVTIDGLRGWEFTYSSQKLAVVTRLLVDRKAKRMYQLSCQATSPVTADQCESAIASASR